MGGDPAAATVARAGTDLQASAGSADSPRSDPIRALIVDDHALFRRGLEMVLAAEDDIELVGEASDGAEAVEKAGEALPDVVLMDIRMPKSSGIEACRAMKEVAPSSKIVMLTISDEEEDLFEAIRAGASGYLLKDIPLDEVADVVRAVHGGQSLINPSMAAKLLTEFAALAKRDGEERAEQQVPAPKLTDREMQVLKLVAKGMNNRDIAKELFISENTVKNHVRNIPRVPGTERSRDQYGRGLPRSDRCGAVAKLGSAMSPKSLAPACIPSIILGMLLDYATS
ncbi:MAG: response regulator transcription factor [Streptosporangiaceae bacterium]